MVKIVTTSVLLDVCGKPLTYVGEKQQEVGKGQLHRCWFNVLLPWISKSSQLSSAGDCEVGRCGNVRPSPTAASCGSHTHKLV